MNPLQPTKTFERIIKFTPAFDKRTEGYGIGSATMYMCLKGELGAAVFSMSTEWFLPETDAWMNSFPHNHKQDKKWRPRGIAVCYCSPKPLMDFQMEESGRANCDWLGCTCWGDCSYTISDEFVETLVSKGSEAVWEKLEQWYNNTLVKYNQELNESITTN